MDRHTRTKIQLQHAGYYNDLWRCRPRAGGDASCSTNSVATAATTKSGDRGGS